MAEWINRLIGKRSSHEVKSEVEIGEREVGEQEVDKLIDELDMQQDLSSNSMIRLPDLSEMNQRVDSREESSIKPSPPLRNKFRNRIFSH